MEACYNCVGRGPQLVVLMTPIIVEATKTECLDVLHIHGVQLGTKPG